MTIIKDASSVKRLQITAASSDKMNRIIYKMNSDFGSFEFYNTKMDNTNSALTVAVLPETIVPAVI